MIVDCAYYEQGRRQNDGQMPVEEAAALASKPGGGFVWIGLHDPSEQELAAVAARFGLHELAVEDAAHAHQRPKLEAYGDREFFLVLLTARYHEDTEEVEFGELHVFLGPGYVVHVRRGSASPLAEARRRIDERPELAAFGATAVLWAIVDKVVDDYEPVTTGIADDIAEVEQGVFDGEERPTQRIYLLRREVIEFYRAVHPLVDPLEALERGATGVPEHLRSYFRDVADHARRVDDLVTQQRELLAGILQANLAVVAVEQNEVVRKVSGWAAIITVPTLIASVYGMNFEHMPELGWEAGYPLALALMVLAALALWRTFKRSGWL